VFSGDLMEQHVRHLRRYASILTGSKQVGDGLILTCLERLGTGSAEMRLNFSRVDLFRTFHDVVADVDYSFCLSGWTSLDEAEAQSLGRLASLEKRDRAIVLLCKVEQFAVDDVARIMDLSREDIDRIAMSASKTLAGIEHHSILIMEDEFLIARDLSRIVRQMGHSVCGVVGNAEAAINVAASQKPSLFLADLQMADGEFDGIRAAEHIALSGDIPVVFVTAYPNMAIESNVKSPQIVRKPFHPASVVHAVKQALSRRQYNAPLPAQAPADNPRKEV
jgi:CheY-like chemotaxis protein/DNA-directed RNA polymerase specialized sigma24 family protein